MANYISRDPTTRIFEKSTPVRKKKRFHKKNSCVSSQKQK